MICQINGLDHAGAAALSAPTWPIASNSKEIVTFRRPIATARDSLSMPDGEEVASSE